MESCTTQSGRLWLAAWMLGRGSCLAGGVQLGYPSLVSLGFCTVSRGKVVLGYKETELYRRGSGYQFVHAADMMYCAENHVRSKYGGGGWGGEEQRGRCICWGPLQLPGTSAALVIPVLLLLIWAWSSCDKGSPLLGNICLGSWQGDSMACGIVCWQCSASSAPIARVQGDAQHHGILPVSFVCPHGVTMLVPSLFSPCPSDEDRGERANGFPAADQEGQLGVGAGQCPAGVQRGQARLHHCPAASPVVSIAGSPAAFACSWHVWLWGCLGHAEERVVGLHGQNFAACALL